MGDGVLNLHLNGKIICSMETGYMDDPDIFEQTRNFAEAAVSVCCPNDFFEGTAYISEKSTFTHDKWYKTYGVDAANYIKRIYARTHMDDPNAMRLSVDNPLDFLDGPKGPDDVYNDDVSPEDEVPF